MTERQTEKKASKTPGYYANYDTGTVLGNWANRKKVFQILTVEPIRE